MGIEDKTPALGLGGCGCGCGCNVSSTFASCFAFFCHHELTRYLPLTGRPPALAGLCGVAALDEEDLRIFPNYRILDISSRRIFCRLDVGPKGPSMDIYKTGGHLDEMINP